MPMNSREQLPTGAARFVGRVGGLAVALGIGLAVANCPGIASATPGEAGSSSSGPSAGASGGHGSEHADKPTTGKRTDTGSKSNADKGAEKTPGQPDNNSGSSGGVGSGKEQAGHAPASKPRNGGAGDDAAGSDSADSGVHASKPRVVVNSGKKSARAAAVDNATESSPRGTAKVPTDTAKTPSGISKPAAVAVQEVSATAVHLEQKVDPAPSVAAVGKAAVETTVPPAPPAPTAAVEAPVAPVGKLAATVLSAVGLTAGPSASGSGAPVAPVQEAALSALLGATRRETEASSTTTTFAAAPTSIPSVASVLGTSQQLTAEQNANAIVNTLPMQFMKLVLGWGFRFNANQLFSQVGGPDQTNVDQLGTAIDEYAQQAAMEYQLLDSMNPTVLQMVMPPHDWFGQAITGTRILYDNPDTIYRMMGVNSTSTYVISGQFGPGERPAETTFSVLTGLGGTTAAVLNAKDMDIDPDGRFTITVSSAPAADGERNHLQIPTNTTLIVARNTLSDWNAQAPMSLSIQRVGGPPDSLFAQIGGFAIPGLGSFVAGNEFLTNLVSLIPPLPVMPRFLQGLEASVILALGLQMEPQYMAVATQDSSGKQKAPNVFTDPESNATFLSTQRQSAGYFQLDDTQALVLTIKPGDASYFVVPVTNDWTITTNYWDQQTSLNIAQSVKNADGSYTIVVSKADPGVANWVSTGGLNQGTISIRFQGIDTTGTNPPKVSSQVVSLTDLGTVLPAGTQYVTAEKRQEILDARKAGYDQRFAPYPQV